MFHSFFGFVTRMKRILFITGTDTNIGKTTFAVQLLKTLRRDGVNAAGLKPVSSGGRNDAKKMLAAMDGKLSLDEINPWHFPAAIAPSLAARTVGKKVKLAQVATRVRAMQKKFDVLVVEGAGGLLSPLGDGFNSRSLILELNATPVIVCLNRLGVVNHLLLTLEALPKSFRAKARVVLITPHKPDAATKTNASLLMEFFDAKRILIADATSIKPYGLTTETTKPSGLRYF
jgi:dethiobiotin synthetase